MSDYSTGEGCDANNKEAEQHISTLCQLPSLLESLCHEK